MLKVWSALRAVQSDDPHWITTIAEPVLFGSNPDTENVMVSAAYIEELESDRRELYRLRVAIEELRVATAAHVVTAWGEPCIVTDAVVGQKEYPFLFEVLAEAIARAEEDEKRASAQMRIAHETR